MNVYVAQLARHLAQQGLRVDVFTRVSASSTGASCVSSIQLYPGVMLHHVPAAHGAVTKTELARHVPEIVERIQTWYRTQGESPALVHSHYWVSGLAGADLAGRWGVPLIHTMHTMARVKLRDDTTAVEPSVRVRAEDWLASTADALTANTPAEVDEIAQLYGAAPEKIHLIPPGVDGEVFGPRGPSSWFHEGPCRIHGALRIAFAGRIQRLKGPQLLLDALQRAIEMDPDVAFDVALIGHHSGPEHLDLSELLPPEQGRLRVRTVPPRRPVELAQWFRGADLVAVPSYSESFGLVAAEAQACGTAVVANAVGGLRYTVRDGETGWLLAGQRPADWAQQLNVIAADRTELQRRGRAAAAHAAQYTWDACAALTLGLYADLTAGG